MYIYSHGASVVWRSYCWRGNWLVGLAKSIQVGQRRDGILADEKVSPT